MNAKNTPAYRLGCAQEIIAGYLSEIGTNPPSQFMLAQYLQQMRDFLAREAEYERALNSPAVYGGM